MDIDLNFLTSALKQLMNGEVKNWGYFRTAKDDEFSYLGIPSLPVLKLYQNDKTLIYRAFWESEKETGELEGIAVKQWKKDANISVRKKQRFVYTKNRAEGEKKQRVYEILCRHDDRESVRIINRLLAELLKVKLESLVQNPIADEVMPQVVIMTE